MDIKLKDWLPLYPGCPCKILSSEATEPHLAEAEFLYLVPLNDGTVRVKCRHHSPPGRSFATCLEYEYFISQVVPILRRIETVSEAEWEASPDPSARELIVKRGEKIISLSSAHMFKYLLSLRLDLFGLIDAGLALDEARAGEPIKPDKDKAVEVINEWVLSDFASLHERINAAMKTGAPCNSLIKAREDYQRLFDLLNELRHRGTLVK